MTDNKLNAIADKLVCNGNTLTRIGGIITIHNSDLLAVHAALGIGFRNCSLNTTFDLFAIGSLTACKRCTNAQKYISERDSPHCHQRGKTHTAE